jgi:hypothetical protein
LVRRREPAFAFGTQNPNQTHPTEVSAYRTQLHLLCTKTNARRSCVSSVVGERKPPKITRMPSIIGYRFDLLLFPSILFSSVSSRLDLFRSSLKAPLHTTPRAGLEQPRRSPAAIPRRPSNPGPAPAEAPRNPAAPHLPTVDVRPARVCEWEAAP